jgi:hypothetical protein
MAFDDLTAKSKQFLIAVLEQLARGDYKDKKNFSAIWHLLEKRWFLTLDGKSVELRVGFDEANLRQLERQKYITRLQDSPHLSKCSLLKKAHNEYRLHLKPAATIEIFVNYREEDTLIHVGPLGYRLKEHFGRDRVFVSSGGIMLADFWRDVIAEVISSCTVMLVLVGPRWLTIEDEDGRRRLDVRGDFVRWEIETALAQGKVVTCVLFEDVEIPAEEELPGSLKELAGLQVHRIDAYEWERDTDRLIEALKEELREAEAESV